MKSEFGNCCYQCYLLDSLQAFDGSIMNDICSYLFATELKHLGDAASRMKSALENTSDDVKWRLQNIVRWCHSGGEAQICKRDASVAFSCGGWYPGGVALADLRITSDCNLSFRFEVTFPGTPARDVMIGLTQCTDGTSWDKCQAAMDTGYEYIMGRGPAPASIFIGGGSVAQCCFSSGDSSGPRVDSLSEGAGLECTGMYCIGQWIHFCCTAGVITATDDSGNFFQWSTKIKEGEIWQPAFAWSGSSTSIRIVQCKRCPCETCGK